MLADDLATYGAAVLERLADLAGGRELIELATRGDTRVALVGGAVRDLILGRAPRELDVVVEGDAAGLATRLAADLGGEVAAHDRFGTALVRAPDVAVDVATARTERYPSPGALPEVSPATIEQDLERRDFAVNAIAVALAGPLPGALTAIAHGVEDLNAGRLRVLHEASFRDDPTRILRLARYAARLGFAPEERTEQLLGDALAADALRTVSGARVGAELRLGLREPDPVQTLREMERLGILRAVHPRLRLDEPVVRAALELLPGDGRPELLLLAALALPLGLSADAPDAELRAWLDRLEFPAPERDVVLAATSSAPRLINALAGSRRPAELRAATARVPIEGIALAGALGPRQEARRWLEELRHVRLQISGDDLLAAGIPAGPDVGRRLAATLDWRLDGELAPGREAELRAALDA